MELKYIFLYRKFKLGWPIFIRALENHANALEIEPIHSHKPTTRMQWGQKNRTR